MDKGPQTKLELSGIENIPRKTTKNRERKIVANKLVKNRSNFYDKKILNFSMNEKC